MRARRVMLIQETILARLDSVESSLRGSTRRSALSRFPLPAGPPATSLPDDHCAMAVRLNNHLSSRGAPASSFIRVPAQYYDEDLPFRVACLKAASVHHLCKSICMENTKWKAHSECASNSNSQWYVVVVQYTARLNQQKIEKFLHGLNEGKIGKKAFHMRLAKEVDSERLTGYTHGGVTPIGLAAAIPVMISDKVLALTPDAVFWLGGGETDLKMSFRAAAFVAATDAFVVDCTY